MTKLGIAVVPIKDGMRATKLQDTQVYANTGMHDILLL